MITLGESKFGASIKKVVWGLFGGFLVGVYYLLCSVGIFPLQSRISKVMELVLIF